MANNQVAIKMATNPINYPTTKYINSNYYIIREIVAKIGILQINYIPTAAIITDRLTKPLGPIKFMAFSTILGLASEPVQDYNVAIVVLLTVRQLIGALDYNYHSPSAWLTKQVLAQGQGKPLKIIHSWQLPQLLLLNELHQHIEEPYLWTLLT